MFSTILNQISFEFAKTQKVLKQELGELTYPNFGQGFTNCKYEILKSQDGKISLVFHDESTNEGTSVCNAIETVMGIFVRQHRELANYFPDSLGDSLRVFEAYKAGNKKYITEVILSKDFRLVYWQSINSEEIVTWLNSEATQVNY